MTPTSPSWADVERFLKADGWRRIPAGARGGPRQTHIFFEKEVQGGLLQTHISHDRTSTISPGRFATILREQLEVSRDEFWRAVRSGDPVERPVETKAPERAEHQPWVIAVLVGELHMGPAEIERLSEQAAIDLVHKHWSSTSST